MGTAHLPTIYNEKVKVQIEQIWTHPMGRCVVQYIMGSGHMVLLPLPVAVNKQNDRHAQLKTLSSCNFVGGR